MANDVDAAEHIVNGSTSLMQRSVAELSDCVVVQNDNSTDPPCEDTVRTDAEDRAGEDVDAPSDTLVSEDEGPSNQPTETDGDTDDYGGGPTVHTYGPNRGVRLALIVSLVTVLALAGLAGWFGYGAYQYHQESQLHNMFLAVGKQGALNLTSINYVEADADIQRILNSSTGQFYDDFSKRAPAFVDVVKQAQAKTVGSIVDAGLESVNGDSARVLVAVLVTTSNKGATEQQPRHWRMRIDVQKVGDTMKVSNVGFVP